MYYLALNLNAAFLPQGADAVVYAHHHQQPGDAAVLPVQFDSNGHQTAMPVSLGVPIRHTAPHSTSHVSLATCASRSLPCRLSELRCCAFLFGAPVTIPSTQAAASAASEVVYADADANVLLAGGGSNADPHGGSTYEVPLNQGGGTGKAQNTAATYATVDAARKGASANSTAASGSVVYAATPVADGDTGSLLMQVCYARSCVCTLVLAHVRSMLARTFVRGCLPARCLLISQARCTYRFPAVV